MGWWKIDNIENGKIDFSHKCPTNSVLVNAIPATSAESQDDLYNGDRPADIMENAFDEIRKCYKDAWGRDVKPEELQAIFNFCFNPIKRGKK